jgi:FkbM family methyltransferase
MQNEMIKKILMNFKFDYSLISTRNISVFGKITFLWKKYFSILLNKRKIKYFKNDFYYDNRFSPAILENYPKEISDIDKAINLSKIKNVMDIGANIGQFSFTLKSLYPKIYIYSFEPNKEIYPILIKNLSNFRNLKAYNFGLGNKTETVTFYFSPTASAEGSIYQENMHQNYVRKDVKKTKVKIIKLTPKIMKKLNIPKKIDLVKIDVEGAEMDVLKSLKSIDFDYLYIEVSVRRKGKGNLKNIKEFLRKEKKTEPKLIYYNLSDKDSPCADAIFSLKR